MPTEVAREFRVSLQFSAAQGSGTGDYDYTVRGKVHIEENILNAFRSAAASRPWSKRYSLKPELPLWA